jgi:hypothetical protein
MGHERMKMKVAGIFKAVCNTHLGREMFIT